MKTKEYKKGNAILVGIIIFVLIVIISIVIGFNVIKDNVDNNIEDISDSNGEEIEESNVSFYWETENIDVSVFDESTLEKVDVGNNLVQSIITTPFNYDISYIKSTLEQNKFMQTNYEIAIQNIENMENLYYKDVGQQKIYLYENNIVGTSKTKEYPEEFKDFELKLIGNNNSYNNYGEITINFNTIKFNSSLQDNIYNAVYEMFGEKIAKALVYAKDDDGLTRGDIWKERNKII